MRPGTRFFAFVVALPTCLSAAEPDVLHAKTGTSNPPVLMFISAPRLRGLVNEPDSASAKGSDLPPALLEQTRKAKRAFQQDGCNRPIEGSVPADETTAERPMPESPAEVPFTTEPLSFLGRIDKLTPGWCPHSPGLDTGVVKTLVTATVTEVLRDDAGRLHNGSQISFLTPAGSFEFESVTFCTSHPDLLPIAVDKTIAVTGEWSEVNPPDVVDNAELWCVQGSAVTPRRHVLYGVKVPPTDLSSVRAFASGHAPRTR